MFNYTRSELRGIIVLSGILIILILFRWFIQQPVNSVCFEKVSNIPSMPHSETNKTIRPNIIKKPDKNKDFVLLNPNTASIDQLCRQGIPAHIAHNIISFRQSGGVFNKPNDLLLVEEFSEHLLTKVRTCLYDTFYFSKHKNQSAYLTSNTININTADSSDLIGLPGIGPVLSKRIVKFRLLLGGFYSINQLSEVYGITDSLVYSLQGKIYIDSLDIEKINLNTTSISKLYKHPYLNRNEVNAIKRYLEFAGQIDSVNQLVDNYLISKETYKKICPYLQL